MGVEQVIAQQTGVPAGGVQAQTRKQQSQRQPATDGGTQTALGGTRRPLMQWEKTDLLFWLQVAEVALLLILVVKL